MLDINTAFRFFEDDLPALAVKALNANYEDQELNLSDVQMLKASDVQFNRYASDGGVPYRYIVWSWGDIDTYNPSGQSLGSVRRKAAKIQGVEFLVGLYSKDDIDNPIIAGKRFSRDVFRLGDAISDTGMFQVNYGQSGLNPDSEFHFSILRLVLR